MNLTRKGGLAAIVVAALVAVGVVSTAPALAASATSTPPAGQCVVDTIHHDARYQYSQVIPGQTETYHTEYRFRTRTVTYGEVEHKYVKSTYAFVEGGTTNVNGHVVSGHWVGGYALGWRAIPDSIINAVWGSGGIPSSVIGGTEDNPKGNVNLNVYGGPNVSVQYYAATEQNPSGYTDWGPWSGWSTTNPGAASATREVEVNDMVSNNDGTPDQTIYWQEGGLTTTDPAQADWTDKDPGSPWVQIASSKQDAYDEDVYGPCPPQPCVTDFDPATGYVNPDEVGKEPTQVAAGLEFGKGDLIHFPAGLVSAVGLHDLAYTIVSSTGPSPAYKMEVFANGTTGYGTWNWEPSNNGFALNATGTFTNLENGKWWSSKIPSGPGSISQPIPYADLVAIYGGLTKIISFGTGIGSTTESTAVVSSMTFLCGTGDFTKPPTEFEPASPTKVDVCGVANDSFTLPGAQPNELESITPEGTYTADDLPDVDGTVAVTFTPTGNITVKDDPNADYEVDQDGNAVWLLVFTDEACPVAVTPNGPTKVDACGTANDTFTIPGAKPGVRELVTSEGKYTATGDPTKGENVVVTLVPNASHTVKPSVDGSYEVIDGNAVWTLTYTNVSCPTPTGGLPNTGSNPGPLIALLIALLAAGAYMVREGYWRRKTL